MVKSEPAFVRDYFPAWGAWQVAPTNGGMGGANLNVPFKWNFDEFEKTGSLPGGACNAGFESTDIEVKRPSDWHVWPVGQTEANLIDTTVARTGKNSLHIKFDPAAGKGASYVVYQHVPRKYVAGKSYTYSCYVKTQDLKGSAYIAVLRYPLVPEDRQLIRCERVLKGTNDWTRLAVTFPVREGMAETSIRCHADGTQGEVWFDDVEFAEAAPAATPAAPARP
jgi:hypothetical protein